MNVVKRQLGRDDVETVVNACDAGREGELIFAYLYEKAGSKKPVQRLWLNSMTTEAIKDAFGRLRPGLELASLEAAARSRSEADWIVGHERDPRRDDPSALLVRRGRLAGAGADADAGDPRPPRAGDPRLQARAVLGRRRALRHRPRTARAATRAATTPAPTRGSRPPRRPRPSSATARARPARSPSSRSPSARSARRCSTTSPRCSATPTPASASPRAGRWPRPSGSTRSTRRSPIRGRTRAT